MNRLILVRHGGSTGNENAAFYSYSDSAVCLTTNGIEQALSTAAVLDDIDPTWMKPGNFNLELFASEYARSQQTCRICLDQMGLLSIAPRISPLLNERNYGTAYLPAMDSDPDCTANGSGKQPPGQAAGPGLAGADRADHAAGRRARLLPHGADAGADRRTARLV